MFAAAPFVTFSWNVAGAIPATDAWTVSTPTDVPRVITVEVCPLAAVTLFEGDTEAPPESGAKLTVTPPTGLPNWSRTVTVGRTVVTALTTVTPSRGVVTGNVWLLLAGTTVIVAGAAGWSVAENVAT